MSAKRSCRRLDARSAAYLAVLDVFRGEGFVQQRIARLRSHAGLDAREAALATEIALGTIRHLHTLRAVLGRVARYDERRVKPALRAVLYPAAFQVIWLNRIPDFAAVDEAVRQARERTGARAAGMVNAVLRNLTRAIEGGEVAWTSGDAALIRIGWDRARRFSTPVLAPLDDDGDPIPGLADATGCTTDELRRLVDHFGFERAVDTAWAWQATPPVVVHRNPLRADAATFTSALHALDDAVGEIGEDVAFLGGAGALLTAALFREGGAIVQDVTAHAAAGLVEARPGESILDLCAAPGGKAAALAIAMQDRGRVVACDVAPERVERIRENAQRLGLRSLEPLLVAPVTATDPHGDALRGALPDGFDAVLIDVPCSNTGVIARRPEARLGRTAAKLRSLTDLQHALLRAGATLVRPGGRLVYSTCSIEPEENERVVTAFLDADRDWTLEAAELTLPRWGPALSDWRDGGYAARLRRVPR